MLDVLLSIAEILSILLILPGFITSFMIIKEFTIRNIRFSKYYKLLLAQVLLHSLFLVGTVFDRDFLPSFLAHSFIMIPLYVLLVFRIFHRNIKRDSHLKVTKESLIDEGTKKRLQARRYRERLRLIAKSKWK